MFTLIIIWVLFSCLQDNSRQNEEILAELRKSNRKKKSSKANTRTRTMAKKDDCVLLQETVTSCDDDDEDEITDWGYDKVYDNIYNYLK